MNKTMRRKDFECSNEKEASCFLDSLQEGTLATLTSKGLPSIRPMNFVRIDNFLYFHGAKSGEKVEGLSNKASFNVYRALSLIPSYWLDELSACPATVFYQSVIIKGEINLIIDIEKKSFILQKFMEKLQPERGHLPFPSNLDFYKNSIKGVSIFALSIEELSYKVKLGQNWNEKKRNNIYSKLIERGTLQDIETAKLMKSVDLLK